MAYTQVLKIEIDGCHDVFEGNHTPGIVRELEEITKFLNKGVQLIKYPFYSEAIDGTVIAKVDLVETDDGNPATEHEGKPSLVKDLVTTINTTQVIELPGYDIVVTLNGKSGTITSALTDDFDDQNLEYEAAINAVESLILSCACAGVDITSKKFIEAIDTTIDAIGNTYGD